MAFHSILQVESSNRKIDLSVDQKTIFILVYIAEKKYMVIQFFFY